jgi:hypothetical protein
MEGPTAKAERLASAADPSMTFQGQDVGPIHLVKGH